MITFNKIKLKNFMSYGNKETTLDLDFNGLKLILGENKDQPMESSNGAGKSQLINAIIYSLFGRGIDGGLKSNEFINFKNKKGMYCQLEFTDGKRDYIITRGRKPNKLELMIDGEVQTLDSMKNTDEMIEKIIGMNFETFMTCFFLSPHRKNYMAMPPAEQRDLFETILSLDALSERAESVKNLKKDYEIELKMIDRDIDHAKKTNDMIEESVDRLLNRWKRDKEEYKNNIKQLKKELNDLNEFDEETLKDLLETKNECNIHREELKNGIDDVEKSIQSSNEKLNDLSSMIRENSFNRDKVVESNEKHHQFDQHVIEEKQNLENELCKYEKIEHYEKLIEQLENNQKIEQEIEKIESDKKHAQDRLKVLLEDHDRIKSELDEMEKSTCPTCGQKHTFDKKKLKDHKSKIESIKDEMSSIESMIEGSDISIHELRSNIVEDHGESIDDLRKVIDDVKKIMDDIEHLNQSENPYDTIDQSDIDKLNKTIKKYEKQYESESKNLNHLKDKKESLKEKLNEVESIYSEVDSILSIAGVHDEDGIERLHRKKEQLKNKIETDFDDSEYESEMEDIKSKYVEVDDLLSAKDNLTKKVDHAGTLIKLLTDNKSFIRKNIVSRYVPFVNNKILEYTMSLGLTHHTVKIESDLSSTIEYMGENVSYSNMSAGERLRLQTAVAFAFRDLMSMMGREFNMMFVDELIDSGGDASMTELTLDFIQNKTNALMISHKHEALEHIPHTDRIMIHKINGFSRIIE